MARKLQINKPISKPISECLELFIKHCQSKNLSQNVTVKNEWNKADAITWTERFRECIDTSLDKALTIDEFVENMKKENIKVHMGKTQDGIYFKFYLDSSGKTLHRNSTTLGEGYSKESAESIVKSYSPRRPKL